MGAISLGTIMTTVNVVKSIAAFLEMTKSEIEVLKQSEFNTAMRDLKAAMNSENERETLLRDARRRFQKSIDFETGLRLAYAHLGLSICYRHLGDHKNSKDALREILKVEPPGFGKEIKARTRDIIKNSHRMVMFSMFKPVIMTPTVLPEEKRMKMIKRLTQEELYKLKDEIELLESIKLDVSGYLT